MTDSSWTIDTASNGSLTFPGAIADSMPTFGAGREVTLLLFASDSTDSDYETLHEYARYLNDSTTNTGTDIRGKPWYHESINPSADFTSTLVRLTPGDGITNTRSWWCVMTDATIETNNVGTAPRIALTVFVLGEGSAYSQRNLAVAEFEEGL